MSILAETAEISTEIDVERAREALRRAEEGSDEPESLDAGRRAQSRLRAAGERRLIFPLMAEPSASRTPVTTVLLVLLAVLVAGVTVAFLLRRRFLLSGLGAVTMWLLPVLLAALVGGRRVVRR